MKAPAPLNKIMKQSKRQIGVIASKTFQPKKKRKVNESMLEKGHKKINDKLHGNKVEVRVNEFETVFEALDKSNVDTQILNFRCGCKDTRVGGCLRKCFMTKWI
jgi:predicted ATP-dependent Lon-type protease